MVIEFNLDLICCADRIFDLGTGVGDKGVWFVLVATPELLMSIPPAIRADTSSKC